MSSHDHHHDHDHSELSETELRVRALETILTEKGYVDPAALDAIIQAFETKIGPHNGAQVVAKAWSDPAFKQALLDDATKAVSTLGHFSRVGDHIVAIENTPKLRKSGMCAGSPRGQCRFFVDRLFSACRSYRAWVAKWGAWFLYTWRS